MVIKYATLDMRMYETIWWHKNMKKNSMIMKNIH